jgi:hypothetical protein
MRRSFEPIFPEVEWQLRTSKEWKTNGTKLLNSAEFKKLDTSSSKAQSLIKRTKRSNRARKTKRTIYYLESEDLEPEDLEPKIAKPRNWGKHWETLLSTKTGRPYKTWLSYENQKNYKFLN